MRKALMDVLINYWPIMVPIAVVLLLAALAGCWQVPMPRM